MTKTESNSENVRKDVVVMFYIDRAIEPLLVKKYQAYKCFAITGARQVGKTRMTKELYPKTPIFCKQGMEVTIITEKTKLRRKKSILMVK